MAADKKTNNPPIAIITAVPFEAEKLLHALGSVRKPSRGITTGRIDGARVVHMCSGPGMANAAHAATVLVELHSPSRIILTGIGGAFHGTGIEPGDVVAAQSETYAELGALTPEGFLGASKIGLHTLTKGCREYFESFQMDSRLLRAAKGYVKAMGPFITVSTVTGTKSAANKLLRRFPGLMCENMEGAAVAHMGKRYGIPVLEIRGVSNMVEDRDTKTWKKGTAAENSQEAVLEVVRGLSGRG